MFSSLAQTLTPYSGGLDLGDVDGDGDLDLVMGARQFQDIPGSSVLLNDGTGVFVDSMQSVGTLYNLSVVLVDLDEDGDLDLVHGLEFHLNDGTGTFETSTQTITGFSFRAFRMAVGDLDKDGDDDLVTAGEIDFEIEVFLNNF